MAHAAGVAGEIHPLGKGVGPSQAGGEGGKLVLGELGGLVQEDHIVFLALVLKGVPFAGAVAEFEAAAVMEHQSFFQLFVVGRRLGHGAQGQDVVFPQFGIAAAKQQQADAVIVQGHEQGFLPHGPAFPAAPGAAIGDKAGIGPQKFPLPGGWLF